ncbi:MAG: hypothetical protein ACM3S4_00035 [Burkholderiales bacterium]
MEEIHYRQEKKKYKDKYLKFADEGKRYKPRKKKWIKRSSVLAIIAAAAAVLAVITIIVSQPAYSEVPPAETSKATASAAPSIAAQTPEPEAVSASEPAEDATEPVVLEAPAKAPFVYENGGRVYLAHGEKRAELGARDSLYGSYGYLNAMPSGDNRWLYYISVPDSAAGTGTLMKAPADASSEPEAVAEKVCAARVSYDGSRVMYFKEVRSTSGSLYILSGGGEELVAENAVPDFFEFSPAGRCVSYFTEEGGGTFALYVKKAGAEPEFVAYVTAEATINDGVKLSSVGEVKPLDNGDVLYSVEEEYNTPLYLYSGGSVKTICDNGFIVKAFASGDFLYGEKGLKTKPLWYKAPGAEPALISENYDYTVFPERAMDSSGFLLVEHIGDGADNPGVMMYVISQDKIKSVISLADSAVMEINNSLDCVTYIRDKALYASRKTDSGWKETYLAKASAQELNGPAEPGMHVQFDESGANLYFSDEFGTGPLYRFSVSDGSITKLISKVDWFRVAGDTPFAHTTDDRLYRFADGAKVICKGARELIEAEGGAYVLTDTSVLFIDETGRAKQLGGFTDAVELPGVIGYTPPLGEDTSKTLDVLAREAEYCLYKLGFFRDECEGPIKTGDALLLAQKLLAKEDISKDVLSIVNKMHEGFEAYELWANRKGDRKKAGRALEKALALYENYLESGGMGD